MEFHRPPLLPAGEQHSGEHRPATPDMGPPGPGPALAPTHPTDLLPASPASCATSGQRAGPRWGTRARLQARTGEPHGGDPQPRPALGHGARAVSHSHPYRGPLSPSGHLRPRVIPSGTRRPRPALIPTSRLGLAVQCRGPSQGMDGGLGSNPSPGFVPPPALLVSGCAWAWLGCGSSVGQQALSVGA